MYSSLSMTTEATPLSAVNTILSGSLLSSPKAFLCSLVQLALGAGNLLSKLLMSAFNSCTPCSVNLWLMDSIAEI